MKIKHLIVILCVISTALTACGSGLNVAKDASVESVTSGGNVGDGDQDDSVDSTSDGIQASTSDGATDGVTDGSGSGQTGEKSTYEEVDISEVVLPETDLTLKDVFSQHGVKVGTCVSPKMINKSQYSDIILENFDSITMENAMKPDYILDKATSIETGDIVVRFGSDVTRILDWARENNMAVRGHTLVWYSQTPDWIFYENFDEASEFVSREVMLARMESYIRQVFELLDELGYSDMFYAYDVVNEAVEDNGMLRSNNWRKIIGDDYLVYAFKYADMYAPENIDLYYNDFNEQFKAEALARMVKTLVDDEGNPTIDGIGLQAHLYTQDDMTKYFNAIDVLSETGLKIEVTELDISLGTWQNTLEATDDNLKIQGKYYYNLIKELLRRKDEGSLSMDSFTFWGFCDDLSWRKKASPLLFDGNLEPKYAYYGALQIPIE